MTHTPSQVDQTAMTPAQTTADAGRTEAGSYYASKMGEGGGVSHTTNHKFSVSADNFEHAKLIARALNAQVVGGADWLASDAVAGAIAVELQSRNRFIDIATMRSIVTDSIRAALTAAKAVK